MLDSPQPTSAATDHELIGRLRSGDDTAFELLVRASMPRLLSTARRFLRNEEDARDAVQSAYIRAFQSIDRFRGDAALTTWLHRIVVNECLMRIRASSHDSDSNIEDLLPTFAEDGHATIPATDWSDSAEVALQRKETREIVRSAIDQLPTSYRTVLLLRDIEEVSTEETAQLLDTNANVIKVRLHRARQALRKLLEERIGGIA